MLLFVFWWGNQLLIGGPFEKAGSFIYTKSFINLGAVVLDSPMFDVQSYGYFFVAQTLQNKMHDFDLSFSK